MANRHGALTAGVILIILGVIFMLEIWYREFSFWRVFARYWPLILIWVGATKLYRYYTWQEPPPVPPAEVPPLPLESQPKES